VRSVEKFLDVFAGVQESRLIGFCPKIEAIRDPELFYTDIHPVSNLSEEISIRRVCGDSQGVGRGVDRHKKF
jgi:hypothetical protein